MLSRALILSLSVFSRRYLTKRIAKIHTSRTARNLDADVMGLYFGYVKRKQYVEPSIREELAKCEVGFYFYMSRELAILVLCLQSKIQ